MKSKRDFFLFGKFIKNKGKEISEFAGLLKAQLDI
jgi:hypothetical protein